MRVAHQGDGDLLRDGVAKPFLSRRLGQPQLRYGFQVFLDVVRREFRALSDVFMMHEPWAAQFLTDFTFFRS